jgi:hypothetical protein
MEYQSCTIAGPNAILKNASVPSRDADQLLDFSDAPLGRVLLKLQRVVAGDDAIN